ncbi:DNA-processing protein DprA [Dactylosporangium sp. CA-139066]|uniref:DNA-processing protein DprA n=1 Tax=Dactylosporangium sp. CA-139066 TaxID=3239930 RepID=UPI003D8E6976
MSDISADPATATRIDRETRLDYLALALSPLLTVDMIRTAFTDGPAAALRLSESTPHDAQALRRRAVAELATADAQGARIIVPGDGEWPNRLDDLNADQQPGAPACLWVRGGYHLGEIMEKSVVLTGARAATSYGLHTAGQFAATLTEAGWTIANGGGFGADSAAMRTALVAYDRSPCVVLLASGLNRPFPSPHAPLFEDMAAFGLLVSPFPFGTYPNRGAFTRRQDILTAMSSATLIVESVSGKLARSAKALGRPLFAVPGPANSAYSAGCHALIRDGARLVATARDFLDDIAAA